jgi:hypothetical protein
MLSWIELVLVRESSLTAALLMINDCVRQCNRLPGIKLGPCDEIRLAGASSSGSNMRRDNIGMTIVEDCEEESEGHSTVTIPTKGRIVETRVKERD